MPDSETPHGPRRVVILIDSLVGGGAERVAVELAAGLDPHRFEPHLLVTRFGGPLEAVVRRSGLPVTILGRRCGFAPGKLARALRLVRGSSLVHAHKFPGGCWGVLLGTLATRPVIVHEHSAYGGSRTLARTVLYRHWIGRRAKAVVCVSDDIATSLRGEGVPGRLLRTIPNGVPTNAIADRETARSRLGLDKDGIVVGMVGRLAREKRHDLVLRATQLLARQGRSFRLCLVGTGPQRADLEHFAADLGVDDMVRWAGEVEDAGRIAGAFDVSVLCSDFEGLPLAALEALAAGVPLVATAVGGLPELLAGGAGVIVPRNDDDALAQAIGELLDDDALRARMGRAGADLVARRFSAAHTVEEVEKLYDDVLDAVPDEQAGAGRA